MELGQSDNDGKRFFTLMSCHMWRSISDHCKPKCERWNNKAFRGKQRNDFGVGNDFLNTQNALRQEKKWAIIQR